jgi:hypothetical protein
MKNNLLKLLIALTATAFSLAGCLYGQCINGPCALEHKRIVESIKPYGAHWVKEGMTRDSRRDEFVKCGGSPEMREGYEIQSGQSASDFFKGFNAHVIAVAACMRANGYVYVEKCDASCFYP